MRTDDLIAIMAADLDPAPRAAPQRRLALAAVAGGAIAFALVLSWLGLRPDLERAAGGGFFWVKAGYTALLGLAGFWASERLARPGAPATWPMAGGAGVASAFVALAAIQMATMPTAEMSAALRGVSWSVCTRNILILGAPMVLLALAALRSLAPTRPALAGFAAGGFAGGVAATVYGLHCPEATLVFVGVWYTLGVFACASLGALVGRWALRW